MHARQRTRAKPSASTPHARNLSATSRTTGRQSPYVAAKLSAAARCAALHQRHTRRAPRARCADSFSIRTFLHYGWTERTPDHSTLTVIHQRLTSAIYQEVFALVLRALRKHHLLRGKRLAIDASTLEANASRRSLEHRLSGEAYGEYLKRLAETAGVDPTDVASVRPEAEGTQDQQ